MNKYNIGDKVLMIPGIKCRYGNDSDGFYNHIKELMVEYIVIKQIEIHTMPDGTKEYSYRCMTTVGWWHIHEDELMPWVDQTYGYKFPKIRGFTSIGGT